MVNLTDDDKWNAYPIIQFVTTKGKKSVSKTLKKSAPKVQEKAAPKKAFKNIVPKVKSKKSSRYMPRVLEKFNTF